MIVVRTRGGRIVLTGWRACLAGALTLAIAWMLLSLLVFVVIGTAVTVGLILLLLVPALLVLALVQRSVRGGPS